MSTPAEALAVALSTLQALEREHGDSAAALEGRRARHRDAQAVLDDLHRRIKAADPDGKDFVKLSAERSTARDREEALKAQFLRAEGEHKGLGERVRKARAAHGDATRADALARIHESSAKLTARLRAFVGQFAPEVAAHLDMVVKENIARGHDPAAGPYGGNPFGVWGTRAAIPETVGFWEMLGAAFFESLPQGSPERATAERTLPMSPPFQSLLLDVARSALAPNGAR